MSTTEATPARPPPSTTTQIQTQHQFLDFAPEIRNKIYHYLFEDETIIIRELDFKIVHQDDEQVQVKHFERNRSLGLNLLFASKQVYAEAKPVLMGTAIFDFDHWTFRRRGDHSVFRASDLAPVRSLTTKSGAYAALKSAFGKMTSLHNVTVEPDECAGYLKYRKPLSARGGIAQLLPKEVNTTSIGFPVLKHLEVSWKKDAKRVFIQFLQNSTRCVERDPPKFIMKVRVGYRDDDKDGDDQHEVNVCFDIVTATAWVEQEGRLILPKVKVKGLTAYLD